jgi:hypothetical protein
MESVEMFLLGGPAFSGKTLLAHLLNQDGLVCLDEPDFHDPSQSHRGIPLLEKLFPDKTFPAMPERKLSARKAVELIAQCQEIIRPHDLGVKTSNWVFVEYARIYKRLGYPVIAVVRDIRDAFVEAPLPEWVTEKRLNKAYRLIWANAALYDLCLRYEDLVTQPEAVMAEIAATLSQRLQVKYQWSAESIHPTMFKLERHGLLRLGAMTTSQVGLWKNSDVALSKATHKTAVMMGYSR